MKQRDIEIVRFVSHFKQVTPTQISRVVFGKPKPTTSWERAKDRLLGQKLIARLEIPRVGGARGGSGQYVYYLGEAGWRRAGGDKGKGWNKATSPWFHQLGIAEAYADLYAAQAEKQYTIAEYIPEPWCHQQVGYVEVKPDLFIKMEFPRVNVRAWLEIDKDSEHRPQLRTRMKRYHDALEHASDAWRSAWPFVIWIVDDEKRRALLQSVVDEAPAAYRVMHRVCLASEVVETVTHLAEAS